MVTKYTIDWNNLSCDTNVKTNDGVVGVAQGGAYTMDATYISEFGDSIGLDGEILLLQFLLDLCHALGDVLVL